MAVIHITEENYDKEVTKERLPLIIDFWAEWCGPCRMMGPVFEELSTDYTGKLKFLKLSTEEHPDLASQFSIIGIPCLVVLKNGKEVDRIVGFMPKPNLKKKIDEILKGL